VPRKVEAEAVPDMPKLVKDDSLLKIMDEVATELAEIVDEVVDEVIDDLEVVMNPENLIGKPYETWTPTDMQWLTAIYGQDNDSVLSKFIAKKEVAKMWENKKLAEGGS
jgi:hypothetical protein